MLAVAGFGLVLATGCSPEGELPTLEPITTTIADVGAVAESLNVDDLAARVGEWANEPVTIGGSDPDATFVAPTRNPDEPTVGETLEQVQPTIDAVRAQVEQFVGGVVGTAMETVVSAGNTYVQRVQEAAQSGTSFESVIGDLEISVSDLLPGGVEISTGLNSSAEVEDVLPDPGPGVTEMVQIVTREALKRGIPPEYALAKLWYEGGYFWDPTTGQQVDSRTPGRVWVGLRNLDSSGELVTSYAGCAGVGQVCPQWHPEYDLERAKNDPEYAVAFALDFMSYLYDQTGTWDAVTGRYHSPSEAPEGQRLTQQFLTNPPINPETGQPAWEAQPSSVLSESTRRPALSEAEIDALLTPVEPKPIPTEDPNVGGGTPIDSRPALLQWAQYYQEENPAPWKVFVAACEYRGCDPTTDPDSAQELWDSLNLAFLQAEDVANTDSALDAWASENDVPTGELEVIKTLYEELNN
jgi:hypothetical protein